jgi:ABC-2 type transport system permease protein
VSRLWALTLRELRTQLVSPVAWTAAAGFLLVAGYFFFNLVSQFAVVLRRAAVISRMYDNPGLLARLNLNDLVVSRFMLYEMLLLLVVMPILTMRTVAEERRQGTDELLLTAPVGPGAIVTAKYLGVMLVGGSIVMASVGFLGVLLHYGDPELGPMWTGMLGLVLVTSALAALGIAVSATTDNQVVAAVGSLVLFLMLFVVDWPAGTVGGGLGRFLESLSLPHHFESFRSGLIRSPDVVYFLSLTALGLVSSRAILSSQRWR